MDRAITILKKIAVRLFWCPRCNVPVLGRRCGICDSPTLPIKLTPPGDVRPAIGAEYREVYSLLKNYIGSRWREVIPRRKVVLLNKVQYPDMADEVIIDGQVVFHRFYDLKRGWRIKPLYPLVHEMTEKRVGYYAVVDLPKVVRGYEVHRDKVLEANLPDRRSGEYLAVVTRNRSTYGVAKVIRSGRLRVVRSWTRRLLSWNLKDPSWRDVVRANEWRLLKMEQEAVNFIKTTYSQHKLPVFVSFSGGKDSLVTYYLVYKALGKVPILFNNTGIELPETVRYVRDFARRNDVELIEADAGEGFWRGIKVMGPPARDFRWCCKVAKLAPISREVKKLFPNGALSFVGQRKFESAMRALSPRVWRNRWMPEIIAATPILTWTALDVWMYIFLRKLLPNKLYYLGFDRLGCWLCPASEIGEFENIKRIHPSLWERWVSFLERYAEQQGFPKEWVKYGLWRWIKVPRDIRRELGFSDLKYKERRGADVDITYDGKKALLRINSPDIERIKDFLRRLTLGGQSSLRESGLS